MKLPKQSYDKFLVNKYRGYGLMSKLQFHTGYCITVTTA